MMDTSGGEGNGEKVDLEAVDPETNQLSENTMLDEGDNGDADADDLLQGDDSSAEDEDGLLQQKAGGVKRKAKEIAQPNPKKQLTNNKKSKTSSI
jgi:hypothetical protein